MTRKDSIFRLIAPSSHKVSLEIACQYVCVPYLTVYISGILSLKKLKYKVAHLKVTQIQIHWKKEAVKVDLALCICLQLLDYFWTIWTEPDSSDCQAFQSNKKTLQTISLSVEVLA